MINIYIYIYIYIYVIILATYYCYGYRLTVTGGVTGGTLAQVYPEGKMAECVGKITVNTNTNKMTGSLAPSDETNCGYVTVIILSENGTVMYSL